MDTTPAIQTYIVVTFVIFVGFAGLLFSLLISLLSKHTLLKKARAQLQQYSTGLEKMVEERTAELRASEEKYRNLFESSREAVIVVNRQTGTILKANNEAASLFGYAREDLLARKFRDFIVAEIALDEQQGWEEHVVRRQDGSQRYIDCLIGEIVYEGWDCWQIICRDITEKRELEVQLIQSTKMSALGQLAAGVAHELNTPLGTIRNSNYFLKMELTERSAKVVKHLELIESQVERCRKIIRDLLNFSRSPSPTVELRKTDINELLDLSLTLMEKEIRSGGIRIIKNFAPLPDIMIDASRISQVLFNLILNAIQAMPGGGQLTIKTWYDSESFLGGAPNQRSDLIHVCIEDTGIGIAPDLLPKIFTPFFTTRQAMGGVGLGLSVSYQIIKQFHGDIKVESIPGVSTRFSLSLPLAR